MNDQYVKISFNMPIQEHWFTKIKNLEKPLEGRKKNGSWSFMRVGMYGHITSKNDSALVKVTNINYYDTLEEYLVNETVQKCLPGIETVNEAKKIYTHFQIDPEKLKNATSEEILKEESKAEREINEFGMQAIYFKIIS